MFSQSYYETLSKPFAFNNELLYRTLRAISPTFTQGECLLSALPPSFKRKMKSKHFSPGVFYMLATSMTCSVLVDGTLLTDDYDNLYEYLQEILVHFGTSLIAKHAKPRKILTDKPYTYNLLTDFCKKCDIELVLVKELKYAYHFVSVALFEEGASDALVDTMDNHRMALDDYFKTPEEFSAIYYPRFMKSEYATGFSKKQLVECRPYIELFSKRLWDEAKESPYDWSLDSVKKVATLILYDDLNLQSKDIQNFLQVLSSFLRFLDVAFRRHIAAELLPALHALISL
jgi:thiol-disulfide isomerase/thioredoxin